MARFRRLTGPSLLLDGPGAALEAMCPAGREDPLIDPACRSAPCWVRWAGPRPPSRAAASSAAPVWRSAHRWTAFTLPPWSTNGPARRQPPARGRLASTLESRPSPSVARSPTTATRPGGAGRSGRPPRRRLHPGRPPGLGRSRHRLAHLVPRRAARPRAGRLVGCPRCPSDPGHRHQRQIDHRAPARRHGAGGRQGRRPQLQRLGARRRRDPGPGRLFRPRRRPPRLARHSGRDSGAGSPAAASCAAACR